MAISGTVFSGTETIWGFAQESTFGTAIADNAQFFKCAGPPPTVDEGVVRMNERMFNGSRVREDSHVKYIDEGQVRVISFSDLLFNREDLGEFLYAVCQNVAEGASTPYEKTFTIDETTTQPDFSANAGYFATIGIYDVISSYHRKYTSCILRTLTLSCDLTGDGLLRGSGEWISGFAADTTANFSGTWSYHTQAYYNMNKPTTKTLGGADIVLFGWDMTITNNGVRVGADSNGDCETYALPEYDIRGNITVKYDANTDGFIADSIAGTGRALQIATGTDGATGNFDVLLDETFFENIDKVYDDERGQAISIPYVAAFSTGNDLAVITNSDGADQTW